MRRRLYFLLPETSSARRALDALLLARIEARHIHFLGQRGSLPPDLPEAGVLLVLFPPGGVTLQPVTVLIAALLGALLGAWMASLAAAAVPNSMLREFQADIERGRILMMVDVPLRREKEISDLIAARHPEIEPRGIEPTLAFP